MPRGAGPFMQFMQSLKKARAFHCRIADPALAVAHALALASAQVRSVGQVESEDNL